MSEKEQDANYYLIPANVSTRFEFFEGFGWYELMIVLMAALIGLLLYLILGLFQETILVDENDVPVEITIDINQSQSNSNTENFIEKKISTIPGIVRVLAILVPTILAFFITKRDPSTGLSMIYIIKSFKEFKNKQKRYLYKYNSGSEG